MSIVDREIEYIAELNGTTNIPEVMSKDSILLDFLRSSPFMNDEWLYFDFLREHEGSYSVSPVPGERTVKSYIDGSSIRRYDFALQLLLQVSDTTDFVNLENVLQLRYWQDWIDEQQKIGNYPDFGINCSDYRWYVLDNMPTRAQLFDNGMAKYQFFARLQYREVL